MKKEIQVTTINRKPCVEIKFEIWMESFKDSINKRFCYLLKENRYNIIGCFSADTEEDKYNIWTCFAVLSCEKKEIYEEMTDEQAQIFENRHRTAICNDETFHPGWDILHLI